MDIILFGMQGSGKGTQGKILAERYGLKPFVMGDQLRSTIASGSLLGNRIKEVVDRGDLVSDEIIMEMVGQFLSTLSAKDRVLFDGIPRTMHQAQSLLEHLSAHQRDAFALLIRLSEKEAVSRLTQRRICSNCKEVYPAFYNEPLCGACGGLLMTRQDDSNLDSIRKRLESYEKETMPVIRHFSQRDHLIEVDGEQPIPDVTEEMIEKAGYLFS